MGNGLRSVQYPSGHGDTGKRLVDEKGVLYEGTEECDFEGDPLPPLGIVGPARAPFNHDSEAPRYLPTQEGHVVDLGAPYRCAKCGTTRLEVYFSGVNVISARCPDCGTEEIIHDG